ncbi:putative tellurite resistance protein B-like protein [Litoreibacter meonggei]|uniref:Putative tellurite resistance protein B-like protein n=1 Tax=Litoreibacter meonggei TaxID=1049199 RepID=A0A497X4S5_9RHOB|nr:TerB family tellurite resistance protein [Litoreibacter meonggei]RLJ60210.1 putative tellurite resistance protein B-like protein [Litoreibacter meonggei]
MIADFFRRLTAAKDEPLDASDARLALAALLVRVARANDEYTTSEVAKIDVILARHYPDLDATGAAALRAEAEEIEASAHDTVKFTRSVKDAVDLDDRMEVVEALWELVLADGERDHEEEGALRLIAPLLGINDRDSAHARQRVEARLS